MIPEAFLLLALSGAPAPPVRPRKVAPEPSWVGVWQWPGLPWEITLGAGGGYLAVWKGPEDHPAYVGYWRALPGGRLEVLEWVPGPREPARTRWLLKRAGRGKLAIDY